MTHHKAVAFVAAIRRELDKVPMGATVRVKTYRYQRWDDIDAAAVIARAPDGAERWRLDIVGGIKPRVELTLWHEVREVSLALTGYEIAALERADAALWGALVQGLRHVGIKNARSLMLAFSELRDEVMAA